MAMPESLPYRGYPIEALANGAEHLEVCYLLLHGELPSQSALDQFKDEINARMPIDGQFAKIFEGFTASSHPMSMLCAGVGGLAALFHEGLDIYNADHRMESAMQLIAKVPTLAAMSYRKSIGKSFVDPDPSLGYAENFLNMCFGETGQPSTVSPTLASALDRIFILHADHEQNVNLNGAFGRINRMQSIRGYSGRDCRAMGAIPWRSQRGGTRHAE